MLPEEPSTFRRPTPEELPWRWRLEDGAGRRDRILPGGGHGRRPRQEEEGECPTAKHVKSH